MIKCKTAQNIFKKGRGTMKGCLPRFIGYFILLMLSTQINAQRTTYIYGLDNARHFITNQPGNYYIRMGAFHSESNATQLFQSLKAIYPSVTIQHTDGFYTVVVGPVHSAKEIRTLGETLSTKPIRITPTPMQKISVPVRPNPIKQVYQPSPKPTPYSPPSPPIKPAKPQYLGTALINPPLQWSLTASFGYTYYPYMAERDGQTMLGRFVIGRTLIRRYQSTFGLEAGVQSGNTMRLSAPQSTLDILGGLPIQTNVRPLFDFLLTMQNDTWIDSPFFTQLKGGFAYRSWVFEDRSSIDDLYQIAGEVQAGIGYHINPKTSLNVVYQGIFGGDPNFQVNATERTGKVSTIPMQNGVLIGLTLNI